MAELTEASSALQWLWDAQRSKERSSVLLWGCSLLRGSLRLPGNACPSGYPSHRNPGRGTAPAYGLISYLAFPVPLLTNDLARAIVFAPLSLLIYVALGTLIGSVIHSARSASPRR
jgi:hypothetical protein